MFKNKYFVIGLIIVSFLSGIFLFNFSKGVKTIAQNFTRQNIQYSNNWSYCAITGLYVSNFDKNTSNLIGANVEIVYFEESYDRVTTTKYYRKKDIVNHQIYYSDFLQENGLKDNANSVEMAKQHVSDIVFAKALNFLGNTGWEIVGKSFEVFNFDTLNQNSEYKNSVLFKKHVSQGQEIRN